MEDYLENMLLVDVIALRNLFSVEADQRYQKREDDPTDENNELYNESKDIEGYCNNMIKLKKERLRELYKTEKND